MCRVEIFVLKNKSSSGGGIRLCIVDICFVIIGRLFLFECEQWADQVPPAVKNVSSVFDWVFDDRPFFFA